MARRACLISGTTHGIGLETTRTLAQAEYQVLMACRKLKRADLLDLLRSSAPGGIINVASVVHFKAKPDFSNDQERYRGMRVYARSKLANVTYTLDLAGRLAGTGVTVNCLHPGVVGTNIIPSNNPLLRRAGKLVKRFMLTPERGAGTSIYLALSPEVDGVTGAYLDQKQQMVEPSPAARKTATQRDLRELSTRLTGL